MSTATLEPAIDAERKARFDIDGFINYGRVLEPEELQAVSRRLDEICDGTVNVPAECICFHKGIAWGEKTKVTRRDAVWQLLSLHLHDELMRSICEKPLIHSILEALLGQPVKLWGMQVITKPAFHGSEVVWHQDSSYWGQEKRMTCWVAIDDATPFNGCMRMIPGSHKRGQIKFKATAVEGSPVDLLTAQDFSEDTQVYVPVRAGCASIHHPMTLHASGRNETPNRRRAMAITYIAT
jgi:ectoine hydroxylase-related dioxygenase (phytanoyl-CoA dioxygenase family)